MGCIIVLSALCGPASAQLPLVSHLVSQVNTPDYAAYQHTIEDMGLGLYQSNYDQEYRGRDASGSAAPDSLGNQEARAYLFDRFGGLGLSTNLQGTYRNVVAELRGAETPGKIYIVGAHYDTTSGAPRPGGDDNASGVAGVLEAAQVLSRYRFKSTIRFIGFNAEEDGLLGSYDYVQNVVQAGGENVRGMISLDMILRPRNDAAPGLPADLDLGCPNSADDLAWVDLFIAAAAEYVSGLVIDAATPFTQDWGSSDHQPFAQSGYAAFMAIENSVGEIRGHSNSYYHTSSDWSGGPAGSAYDYLFATQVVQAVVAAVAGAAEIHPAPIALRVDQDRDFTYQNTPLITQDRHQVRLNISVLDDPNGNANYAAQVVKASGPGDVTIRPTADPEVWEILGGRAGQGATGPVTLAVQVSGNQYGGEGATTCAITVRLIGDIDGDADVDGDDKAEMNRMLNSLSTPFGEQCFDLDGNGDVDGDDKAALNRMLNSLAVP